MFEEIKSLFESMADKGSLGGVYLAKPTGEVLEEDNTFIEVLIDGLSYFAKPCFAFGSYNIPNKEWLQRYKDEVMVWVAFEHGNPAHAVYLGVSPLDEKAPANIYAKQWKSVHFDYSFDDEAEEFTVRKKDIKDNTLFAVRVHRTGITIGDGKTEEPAVMGNKLEAFLNKLLATIAQASVVTPAGPSPLVNAPAFSAMQAEVKAILAVHTKIS